MQRIAIAALVPLLVGMAPAAAHELTHKGIKIVHPWVPETEAGEVSLRVTLKNARAKAERLLGVSTPIAADVRMLDGTGKPGSGFAIPAHGELALSSEGPHILISGLKKPLRAYDDFELTFRFEKIGSVKVDVIVEETPAGGG
jgi:periplasmic copper chaperone A